MPDADAAIADDPRESGERAPVYSVLVPARALGAAALSGIGILAALAVVERGRTVLSLVVGALVVAILVGPLVHRLGRIVPRALAIALTTLLGIVLAVAVSATVAVDVDRQAGAVSEAAREAIDALPAEGAPATIAEEVGLADTAEEILDGFAAQIIVGDTDPLAAAGRVSQVVVIAVMAAFIVAQGPPLVATAIHTVRRASTRAEIHRVLRTTTARSGSFVRRTLAVSSAHGLVAGAACALLDLPGAIAVGAWVTLAVTLPVLGGFLAWAPVVTLAWANGVDLVLVVVAAVACVVADRWARRLWVHRALHVGPLLTLLGVGIGLYTLGLPGGVVGLMAVAAVAAAMAPGGADIGDVIDDLVEGPDAEDEVGWPAAAPVSVPVRADRVGPDRVLRLRLTWRTAAAIGLVVVGAVALLRVVEETHTLVVWVAVGLFIAIGLDRPVSALHRAWKVPRVVATTLVLALFVGLLTAVTVLAGPSVTDSAAEIVEDAPAAVRSLESLPILGDVIAENDVSERLEEEIAGLPDRVRDVGLLERVVSTAGDGLIGTFWLVSTILATLLDGPRLVDAARRRVPASSRRTAVRFGRAAYTSLSNVAAAAAFVAVLNGTVVMFIAITLGVPLAPVLGLWAFGWNFIPQIGGFVGAAPLVVLAVAQGPWHGVIALATFVAYQSFENHVLQPAVGSRAVDLPPLVVLVGVLLGGTLFGFVGAILSGPTLGVAKVAYLELRGERPVRVEDRAATPRGP